MSCGRHGLHLHVLFVYAGVAITVRREKTTGNSKGAGNPGGHRGHDQECCGKLWRLTSQGLGMIKSLSPRLQEDENMDKEGIIQFQYLENQVASCNLKMKGSSVCQTADILRPIPNRNCPPWSADTSCPFQQELHGQLPEARGPRAASPSLPGSPALPSMCVWLVRAGVLARRSLVLDLAEVRESILLHPTMLQGDNGR